MVKGRKKFALEVELGTIDRTSNNVLGRFSKRVDTVFDRLDRRRRKFRGGLLQFGKDAGLDRFLGGVRLAQDGARGLLTNLRGVGTQLTFVAGAATAAGLAVVKAFADAGDDIGKTARQFDFGVEALQEWRFAADRSGVSTATFDQSLLAFTKRLGEARAGFGGLQGILSRTNPELLEQLKATENNADAFALLVDELSRLEDPAARAALAAGAFSRSGVDIARIAENGADGIEMLRKRARSLGGVLDADATKRAEETKDALTDLGFAGRGVALAIGNELSPLVTGLADRLGELVARRGPQIRDFARRFAEGLPDRLRQLRDGARSLFEQFQPVVDVGARLIERFGAAKVAAVVLGGALTVALAPGLVATATAIKGITLALASNPIGLIISGVVLAAVAVYKLEKRFGFLGRIWQSLRRLWDTTLGPIWERVKDAFGFGDGDPKSARAPSPNAATTPIGQGLAELNQLSPQTPSSDAEGLSGLDLDALTAAVAAGVERGSKGSKLRVEIPGAPAGTTVDGEGAEFDFDLGGFAPAAG